MLRLFAIFHLNLAFSSIDEADRLDVLDRCYWPLLRLARDLDLPLGIEATGYTLDAIAALDPAWVAALRHLCTDGPCELVGSGRAQIIGPLIPADVVAANLRWGLADYARTVGLRPRLALVNEQAWSGGLVAAYREAGFDGVVMEWDNAWRHHPEWDPAWRYQPQRALGPDGDSVPVIFSKSIAFQKVQRYAHDELELPELLAYLRSHVADSPRALCLYSNDAEIFDYRPGRFSTEPALAAESEWGRLRRLFEALRADPAFALVSPSAVLDGSPPGHALRLESPEQPIPVKKQGKYNVIRWAATGRDDLGINTRCARVRHALEEAPPTDPRWRDLCDAWASDHRTHTTPARWSRALGELGALEEAARVSPPHDCWPPLVPLSSPPQAEGRFLELRTAATRARLNLRRGLTLDAAWLGPPGAPPLCGTLPHGTFDDIALGADWYSGHVVVEEPGRQRFTDLVPVSPMMGTIGDDLVAEVSIDTPYGVLRKRVVLGGDAPRIELIHRFEWRELPVGTIRLGHVTLVPDAWDHASLRFVTTNGGAPEEHRLAGHAFDHGAPVSFLVSANGGVGLTEGWIDLRDDARGLRIEVDRLQSALVGLVSHREAGGSFFCRVTLTAGELDDTRAAPTPLAAPLHTRVVLRPI